MESKTKGTMKTINYRPTGLTGPATTATATNNEVAATGGVYADKKTNGTYLLEWLFPGLSTRQPKITLGEGVETVGKVTAEQTPEGKTKVTGTVRFTTPNVTGQSKGAARFGVVTNDGKFDALLIEDATGNNVIVGLIEVDQTRSLTTMSEEFKNESENYLNLVASLTTDAAEQLQALEVGETADAGK